MLTFSFFTVLTASRRISEVNSVTTAGNVIYGILYFLFMSAVILGAAYYVTKFIARKGLNRVQNKNLQIIETVPLGIDKSLLLVRVGEQYLLLGSTQKNITLLMAVEQKELRINNTKEAYGNLDGESVESYMSKLQNEDEKAGTSSIKHSLNKLKSIVRGNKIDV